MDEDYDNIPSSTADDELSLPKATVTKMIQEMLPIGISCPRETRDLLLECCVEFIHLIASESNEICEKSNKKTISPEHVLEALKNLSFDTYIEEVESEYREHQTQSKSKEKVKGSKLEQSGLTEEELLRQQEELFERARLRMTCTGPSAKEEDEEMLICDNSEVKAKAEELELEGNNADGHLDKKLNENINDKSSE